MVQIKYKAVSSQGLLIQTVRVSLQGYLYLSPVAMLGMDGNYLGGHPTDHLRAIGGLHLMANLSKNLYHE